MSPEKEYEIIVNGRKKDVAQKKLTFEDVVTLAFGEIEISEKTIFSITYIKGSSENSEGSMVHGDSVTLKNGMIFNVTATDKS